MITITQAQLQLARCKKRAFISEKKFNQKFSDRNNCDKIQAQLKAIRERDFDKNLSDLEIALKVNFLLSDSQCKKIISLLLKFTPINKE